MIEMKITYAKDGTSHLWIWRIYWQDREITYGAAPTKAQAEESARKRKGQLERKLITVGKMVDRQVNRVGLNDAYKIFALSMLGIAPHSPEQRLTYAEFDRRLSV